VSSKWRYVSILIVLLLGIIPGRNGLMVYAQRRTDVVRETIELGGQSGWSEMVLLENVTFEAGWRGGDDIVLADQGVASTARTDLLLSFDASLGDATGNYTTTVSGARIVGSLSRFGAGAAAFDGSSALSYVPRPTALLASNSQTGSFSIDLWIHPLRTGDGVSILRWRGALLNAGSPILQELRLEVANGRLRWVLANLVAEARPDGRRVMSSAELSARRGIVPQRWSHHQLRFHSETGQLTYAVNGIPEAITYLTDGGASDGAVHAVLFGADTGDGLLVGDGFHGLIDELRIEREALRETIPVAYSDDRGVVYSRPVPLGRSGAHLSGIDVRTAEPGQTEVRVEYRVGDLVVSRDPRHALDSSWRDVPPGGILSAPEAGRYIQLRATLLPDAARAESPRLQMVEVHYTPIPPPPIPRGFSARPVPGGVELSWDRTFLDRVGGYRVHVGESPRRYRGTATVVSPVDAGNTDRVVITDLEPDRAYVFAIESYDAMGQMSGLSQEIQIRAGRMEE
jgi:hypothetical protein